MDRKICNCCGNKIIEVAKGKCADHLTVKKEWGYFSRKDGTIHQWNICETCYDQIVSGFKIPVTSAEVTELM